MKTSNYMRRHCDSSTRIYAAFARPAKRGGGVSIYVHSSVKHEVTEELLESGNQYLWIHIDKLSLNVGTVYKPGESNIQNFLNIYSPLLEQRKRVVVFGDFNIDLKSNESRVTQYVKEIQDNGYVIINKVDITYSTRQTLLAKCI